ncbi:MAG: VanZ family protein [Pseudomonadota bacterium]
MIPRPLRIAAFALACAVVAWASLAPARSLPSADVSDKIEHAGAYFVLAALAAWAWPRQRLTKLGAWLFAAGVGVEVLQGLMALGRQGDPADALANSAGIALGLLAALAIREANRVKSHAEGE